MAPHTAKPRTSHEVFFTPTKVSKGSTNIAKSSRSDSARSVEPSLSYRVKEYKNGLLNLEKTPLHLVSIVQCNAAESRLLQLPAEIRRAIWRFALSYNVLQLPSKDVAGGARGSPSEKKGVSSALCLSEVCRQIYSETALLAYSKSALAFNTEYLNSRNGITRLKPAQRGAITLIEPSPEALWSSVDKRHGSTSQCGLSYAMYKPFKQTFFPNLKTIVVGKLAFNLWKHVQLITQLEGDAKLSEDELRQQLIQAFKQREGEDIKVEFKNPDPSW